MSGFTVNILQTLYHIMISKDQKSKKGNVAISPLIDNFLIKWNFLPWLVL